MVILDDGAEGQVLGLNAAIRKSNVDICTLRTVSIYSTQFLVFIKLLVLFWKKFRHCLLYTYKFDSPSSVGSLASASSWAA